MDKDQIIIELASALLMLAHWLDWEYSDSTLEKVESYLETLPIGDELIREYENNELQSFLN